VSQASDFGSHVVVHSSRLWALLTLKFTQLIFPQRMIADPLGISNVKVAFWLMPWIRTDEHLPMSHLAEVEHDRGFFWDSMRIESSGGIDPLKIGGVPKGQARRFVDFVRARMNETPPAATPPQPPRR
jgi:hypothetical protein